LKSAPKKKRKKAAGKRKTPAAKRRRTGGASYVRGGGGNGTRPIVTYPNISGYGGYDVTGYASANFGDTFRAGIQGRAFSDSISGLGAYELRKNTMMGSIDMGTSPPSVKNLAGEMTVITHREYLGDLTSIAGGPPSPYGITHSYAINPGNPVVFPWLAPIASQYVEAMGG